MTRPRSKMSIVMIVVGVILAVVGLIVRNVAAGRKESAELSRGFRKALSGGVDPGTSALDAAVSMSHLGLGFLIAGCAVILAGVMVIAIRRS